MLLCLGLELRMIGVVRSSLHFITIKQTNELKSTLLRYLFGALFV
jgi:hypothetical protein